MRDRYWLVYVLLAIVQILLGNFLNLGQYVMICLLPMLVFSLPMGLSGIGALLITFATSFAVDFLTHGVLGLTTVALLPLAFMRNWLLSLIFGSEIFARGERISIQKQGMPKIALAIVIFTAIFFAIYVWVDAAGTRSFSFNTHRWLISTLCSSLVELPLMGLLSGEEGFKWK